MCNQQSLRSACAYAQSHQSLCSSLEYSMIVKLLTEYHLEFLSLKWGCRGSSESTHVKMSHCWKSHALAQISWSHRRQQDILDSHVDSITKKTNKTMFSVPLKNSIQEFYLRMPSGSQSHMLQIPCSATTSIWDLSTNSNIFFDFSLTVKAAPHECLIRTGQL